MDLVKQFLAGSDPSEILMMWPEPDCSQGVIRAKMKSLMEDFSQSKNLVVEVVASPFFSLSLCPGLVKVALEGNSLEVIEALFKFKGKQVLGKDLGKVFNYLTVCSIPSSFNTVNTKSLKLESDRQGLKLKRADRVRYYLLSLVINNSISIPKVSALNNLTIPYFSFMIRYYMTYTELLPYSPSPDRLLDFLNGLMNSASPTSQLFELMELVSLYTSFSESSHFVLDLLSAHPETLPSKPLELCSKIILS